MSPCRQFRGCWSPGLAGVLVPPSDAGANCRKLRLWDKLTHALPLLVPNEVLPRMVLARQK